MLCTNCGAELAEDAKFCASCGQPVGGVDTTPSSSLCPQCGSTFSPGQEYCSNCGYHLTDTPTEAVSGPRAIFTRRLVPIIVAASAAIMMLVSLALPWYAYRYWGYTRDITFGNLMESSGGEWFGIALPPIILIAIAGVVLLTVIISLVTAKNMAGPWRILGNLAFVVILANAGYLVWWFYNNTGEWVNIVNVGSILVLVAAVVLLVAGSIRSR